MDPRELFRAALWVGEPWRATNATFDSGEGMLGQYSVSCVSYRLFLRSLPGRSS